MCNLSIHNYIRILSWLLCLSMPLYFSGCGNFFEKKPTEIETSEILSEIEQVKQSPFIENPLPEIYKSDPTIIKNGTSSKVFYFTKQHPVATLQQLLTEQYGYKTSINTATNQLIVDCPDDAAVDNTLIFLKETDVQPIQVNIDCIVLERFADVTMDWETTILIENFLGEGITFGEDKFPDPAFPGASLREARRSTFGLDIGYWSNEGIAGHQFRAAVDLLVSRGYLKILMNPVLETVNGKTATIISKENAPLEQTVTAANVEPYSLTTYQWVEDSLKVTPHVYADGSIGLTTEIKIGSRSKPEGVVQQSIITERASTIEENRIRPGDSLVISGIRKSEKRSVIRGIPFFKDLPVIGVLFSSKDYEEKGTEIIFILTPSISSGGQKHEKVIQEIRDKHASPEYDPGLEEVITDPFSGGIYREHVEKRAAEAEYERIVAEIQKAQADEEIELLKEELIKAAQEVKEERQKAEQAKKEAQQSLETVKQATENLKAEQQKTIQAHQEIQKAKAEVEKAKAEAQKAKQETQTIKQQQKQQNPEPNQPKQ